MSLDPVNSLDKWLAEGNDLPSFGTSFAGLGALGKAMVAAAVAQRSFHPVLVVSANKAEAHALLEHLQFFLGTTRGRRLHYLPPADFDYYKGLFPRTEAIAERNVGLFHLLNDPQQRVFVTTGSAIAQKLLPVADFCDACLTLVPNKEYDREALVRQLVLSGYQKQPVAYDPGVFAVRGGVVDIYSPAHDMPLRLEFFGDEIENLRHYDPKTQRSLDDVATGIVLPVSLAVLPTEERFADAAGRVKERLDALGVAKTEREQLIEEIAAGSLAGQHGFLFPTIAGGSASLSEYLPEDTVRIWDGRDRLLSDLAETELPRLQRNHELFEKEPVPVSRASELFLTGSEVRGMAAEERTFYFEEFVSGESADIRVLRAEPVSLENEREASHAKGQGKPALEGFVARFRAWMADGFRVHLVCHTSTHEDRLRLLFEPYALKLTHHAEGEPGLPDALRADYARLHLWQGVLNESAVFPGLRLVLLSEEEIFGRKKRYASGSWGKHSGTAGQKISSFRELKEGDYIVHRDYGIGRYLGLRSMSFLGVPNDYVLVEYKDGDKLYVPSYRLNVIQKYVGGEGATVALDKMGGERWQKAKKKAQRAAQELAEELLKIQARRKLVQMSPLPAATADFQQFEMEFPYDETPDQLGAIEETMRDLEKSYPMDRLIVGDVGYGKTEVAMRAAFRMAITGKQVCVLVPTTVLAFQHFENFKNRFKSSPIRIEMVSRMKKPAENKKTIEELREGKIDVIIGTHRLLSNDVAFKNLGLIVVDEEHRFGVVHKEKLKKLSSAVHVLSMTATPIPRTLNMAMTGIKEISLITTPPPDRMSVRTFVCRRTNEVITEAVTNELAREGQVFFVHNRVETIFGIAKELQELLPKATFEVVHGQMDGETLEEKMLHFYRGDCQVLVTTSLIESGLDIPRANTILIDRADRFGLAQLYQLRGRVGRSTKRGYCYLLAPPENELTPDAKSRLQVIQRYADLGAGFNVASYDLEIRGAGDLLGKQQSGHINAIGIDMYFELLEESVAHLRGEEREESIEPEINLKTAAYFPESYLPDVSGRIALYRQLAGVSDEDEIAAVEEEIRDRFGPLPEEVKNLLGIMRIKFFLKKLHVTHLNCGPKRASLLFAPSTPVTPEKIIGLLRAEPGRYSVTPDNKLVFEVENTDWQAVLGRVKHLVDRLT